MNIWIIHPYAGGPGLGRHRRPYCLAEAFNTLGHAATVICARHHHLLHRVPEASGLAQVGEVAYWFVDTPGYQGNGLARIQNMLGFGPHLARSAADLVAARGRPDVIIASSPHLFQMPAVHRIAKRLGAQFWVEVRDLWPESLVALGLSRRFSPLVMWLSWLERFAYRRADKLISLLANAEPHMRARGLREGRFIWVPNGVSFDPLAAIEGATEPPTALPPELDLVARLKADGRRLVVYTGAMGPPNALEGLIDCARLMQPRQPDVHFVLIGTGVSVPSLKARAQGLPNLHFLPEMSHAHAQAALRQADCAVVCFRGHPLYHHGISPNKLFEYALSASRSVIACSEKALAGMETLVSARCEPDHPEALAHALAQVLNTPPRSLAERLDAVAPFKYTELARRCLA